MRRERRSVSFGKLVVDEFELGVGDNPSVSGGVPVALSGVRRATYKMQVDQFEELRPKRRSKAQLVMDRDTRMNILLSNGCREKDVAEAVRASRNIRHSRERSMLNKGWDPVHEVAEKAFRKVTKPFRGGQSKATQFNQQGRPMTLEHAAIMAFRAECQKKLDRAPEQAPVKDIISN